jgi:hypothetical protein
LYDRNNDNKGKAMADKLKLNKEMYENERSKSETALAHRLPLSTLLTYLKIQDYWTATFAKE